MSLEVQAAFGLRREEALKLRPRLADQGDVLALQASWTKGGKARTVPIRTDAQREVLARAKALAGAGLAHPAAPLLHSAAQNLRTPYGRCRPQ